MMGASPAPERIADTSRIHAFRARVGERPGGYRILATYDGRMSCPTDLTEMLDRETRVDNFTGYRLHHTSGGIEQDRDETR